MVEGLASVVTAKTTMTIAQILFILAGIALGFWLLGAGGSAGQTITAGLVSVGLLLFGVGAFVIVQRQGMFSWILDILRRIGLRVQYLEAREHQLLELDRTIAVSIPTSDGRSCFRSDCFSSAGWPRRWKCSS